MKMQILSNNQTREKIKANAKIGTVRKQNGNALEIAIKYAFGKNHIDFNYFDLDDWSQALLSLDPNFDVHGTSEDLPNTDYKALADFLVREMFNDFFVEYSRIWEFHRFLRKLNLGEGYEALKSLDRYHRLRGAEGL